jgi:MYXO-CTERM domain-containing protein
MFDGPARFRAPAPLVMVLAFLGCGPSMNDREDPTGVVRQASGTTAFPIRASSDGHTFVDQNNVAFRIQGDAAWSLIANLSIGDVQTYLDDRQSRGFNTVLVNLVEHKFAQNAPANVAGTFPFLMATDGTPYRSSNQAADLSTPNDAWFAYADQVIQAAAGKGMLVLVAPAYVGYGASLTPSAANEGWSADMAASGSAKCLAYGEYVGNRYRSASNILWVNVADALPTHPSALETCVQQVMAGIKSGSGGGGSSGLHTAHLSRTHNATDDVTASSTGAWDVNAVYVRPMSAGGAPFTQGRAGYAARSGPAFVVEDYYAGAYTGAPTRAQVRGEAWGDVLSTVGGYVFGEDLIWCFGNCQGPGAPAAWQPALGANEVNDVQRMGSFFDSVAWQSLVPTPQALTAGGGSESNGTYVAVGSVPDGSLLVAYVPDPHTGAITVDLTKMGGPSRARFCDPTRDACMTVAGSLPNAGTTDFTTPGMNAAGANDWVLVLDRASLAGDAGAPDANAHLDGSVPASDAGTELDAERPADASAKPDAESGQTAPVQTSSSARGCRCSSTASNSASDGFASVALLGLLAARRLRRNRCA